ncbi:hypothetical protein [Finch poxvirus]|uniref:Plasmodium RESA N-terminal domain-containing protein n=1 Tax=Condorpox virus TaxID=3049970 RepID=A0AAT9UR98_9POXV|nr:hypothetical protein [Finch poxvirus]UOX39120.1 hypothetical protein [Finch poxvirus]
MCFYNLIDRLICYSYSNKDKKHKYEYTSSTELSKHTIHDMQQYYISEDGTAYEEVPIEEVNILLRYDGVSPCYFGQCTNDLDNDIEELDSYNVDEINGLYLKFLEVNHLTFVNVLNLEDETIDHIIYHFVEYLHSLKTTLLDRRVICKRLLNKDIGRNRRKRW